MTDGGAGPVVVLVEPQLGENIGTAARAMANFALGEMRIVNPRDGWPSESAWKAASGATDIIRGVQVFETVEQAVADLTYLYATTARPRQMTKPVLGPPEAATDLRARQGRGEPTGILFGRERWGLTNDEVALAHAILTYDVNPDFPSLNLAQAVLLIGHELYSRRSENPEPRVQSIERPPATMDDMTRFFDHLEGELDAAGFFRPAEKRPRMIHNLRDIFHRADLREQDVRTLRGVIVALARKKGPGRPDAEG